MRSLTQRSWAGVRSLAASRRTHGTLESVRRLGRLLRREGLPGLVRRLSPPSPAAAKPDGAAPPPAPASPDRPRPRVASDLPAGALLVGHPYGLLGVGEYIRASAAACASAGIPYHIRNTFDWGAHLEPMHGDFPFKDRISTAHPYRVNIFHINADEMDPARRHLGGAFFEGRYNIAGWHWELARFPEAWRPAFAGLDEIWAPSRFIQAAVAEKAPCPVVWMPHPIRLGPPVGASRRECGLPERTFVFLFAFDFTSYATRKNPHAAVRAFKRAFPRRAEPVSLVIKLNGAEARPEEYQRFREEAELDDARVIVINEVYADRRMKALLEQCDCFLSLHRSEGFGRGLAEAMALGKPVVTTAYSGNMDFTNPLTACLVDYTLIPVEAGQYPYPEGQLWADPDVDQAASYLRRLVDDPRYGRSIGERARAFIHDQHGPEAVGRRYRERLQSLGLL